MNINFWLFHLINGGYHNMILDKIMIFFAIYSPLLFVLIMVYAIASKRIDRRIIIKMLMTAVLALAINMLIAKIYFEPRPFVTQKVRLLISHARDSSFPSDHAAGSSALTFAVLGYDDTAGIIMLVITAIVMLARVYVGVHYPLDVLTGLIIGYISSIIVNKLFEKQFASYRTPAK